MSSSQYDNCTAVTPSCPVSASSYGYYLDFGANCFFIVLFSIALLAQLALGLRYRSYQFLIAVGIGTFGEAVGYVGRLMLHSNPWSNTGSTIQVVCLILSPSFITAGIYLTIRCLLSVYGKEHSRLRPRLYTWIFIGGDVLSILTQVAGGRIAAGAAKGSGAAKAGDDLLIAGLASQVATMACCGAFVIDYYFSFRRSKDRRNTDVLDGLRTEEGATKEEDMTRKAVTSEGGVSYPLLDGSGVRMKALVCTCLVAVVAVFIRCVYRYVLYYTHIIAWYMG